LSQFSATLDTKARITGILAETGRVHTHIQAALKGMEHPVIIISSAVPQEGKSILAAGLGICAARNREGRVLLIDAHWHSPSQHKLFKFDRNFRIENKAAYSSLAGQVLETGYPGLDLLPAPEGPDDLNRTNKVIEFITELKDRYALTIVDSAAVTAVNRYMVDPVALAAEADGLAFVVLANKTPRHLVKKACTTCEVSRARILGLVINQYCNPMAG